MCVIGQHIFFRSLTLCTSHEVREIRIYITTRRPASRPWTTCAQDPFVRCTVNNTMQEIVNTVVSKEETILIGRILDVVRLGRGSNSVAQKEWGSGDGYVVQLLQTCY